MLRYSYPKTSSRDRIIKNGFCFSAQNLSSVCMASRTCYFNIVSIYCMVRYASQKVVKQDILLFYHQYFISLGLSWINKRQHWMSHFLMKKNGMDVSTKFYLERKPTVDAQADPGSHKQIFGAQFPLSLKQKFNYFQT